MWNTDMNQAPRAGYGEGRKMVLIALAGTNRIVHSYWLPTDYTNQSGSWFGLTPRDKPYAWRADIEHPSFVTVPVVPKVQVTREEMIPKRLASLPPGIFLKG